MGFQIFFGREEPHIWRMGHFFSYMSARLSR